MHWLWLAITLLILVSIVLPLWYLAGMEESVRHYITAINVASLPLQIFSTLVFVGFLYLLQYGGGFAQFKKGKINAAQVNVKFADVIGLTEAKREALEMVQLIRDRAALQKVGGFLTGNKAANTNQSTNAPATNKPAFNPLDLLNRPKKP